MAGTSLTTTIRRRLYSFAEQFARPFSDSRRRTFATFRFSLFDWFVLLNKEKTMYDPSIGRWLEVDPEGFEAGDANLYRYVGNGPTNGVDPSGMDVAVGDQIPNEEESWPRIVERQIVFPDSRSDIYGRIPPAPIKPFPKGVNLKPPPPAPPQPVGAMGGSHVFFDGLKLGQYVGTMGANPCVAAIIRCPDGRGAVFHFDCGQDPFKTIGQYKWAKGSTALVFGGGDGAASRILLRNVINALTANGIKIQGFSGSSAVLGGDGQYYDTTRGTK